MTTRRTEARVSASGSADPETVWQRYAQPRLWPTWSPQIRSVEYDHPTLRPGTRGVVRTFGGMGIPFEVEEVDPWKRTWAWQVEVLGQTLHLDHGVEPAEGPGSRTWLKVTGPPVISHIYAHVAAIIALRRLVRA